VGYGRKAGFYLCWDLHPVKNSFSCVGESLQESNRIVAVGGDHELLWLRNAVLQSAGFNGLTTNRLAKAFRQKCPEGRIIAISNMKIEKREFADALVYGLEGPETLINALLQQ